MVRDISKGVPWDLIRTPGYFKGPLSDLPDVRAGLFASGEASGRRLATGLDRGVPALVVGGPSDFHAYAAGVVAGLEATGIPVRIACLWSDPVEMFDGTSRMVMRSYLDDGFGDGAALVVASNALDVPQAVAHFLWVSHRAKWAKRVFATGLAEAHDLTHMLAELEACIGEPPDVVADRVVRGEPAFTALHPHPHAIGRKDIIAYEPDFVGERRRLRRERVSAQT